MSGAEDLPPFRRGLQRLAVVAEPQPGLHLARRAAGGGDDARGVLGDDLGVHPRPLAELALERRERRQLEQVAHTRRVLRDHRQVGVGAAARDVVALLAGVAPENTAGVEAGPGRDVGLNADDRLDPGLGGQVVELAGAEHVSVVGHADRRHLQPLGLGQHGSDLRGAVQHRVLGVVMQVHEGRLTWGHLPLAGDARPRSRRISVHRDASVWPCTDEHGRVAVRVSTW